MDQHTPPLHHWERWCRRARPQRKPWRRRVLSSLTWSCLQMLAADAWTPVIALCEGQGRDSGGSGGGWEKEQTESWHPEERKRTCSALGKPALPSLFQPRRHEAGGWASKWIITTMNSRQRNNYLESIKPNINSIDKNFQGEPRIIADTSLGDLCVSSLGTQNLNWDQIECSVCDDQV